MYLEIHDFDPDGHLVDVTEPVFVMIQSTRCGHCTMAKPAFQQLADEKIVRCMTIHGDGERPSERAIVPILNKIYPDFKGYPSYLLFMPDGRRIPYMGPRDVHSMRNFIRTMI